MKQILSKKGFSGTEKILAF